MKLIRPFIAGVACACVSFSMLAGGAEVTFDTPVYVPNMPSQQAGDPVCIDAAGQLVAECDSASVSIVDGNTSGDLLTWDGNNWIARQPSSTSAASSMQPYLGIYHVIALQGLYPSRSASDPFVGEIMQVGFNFAPRGWALCNGQLLAISQNQALYSLLGTTFGGDGRTTFALPDLRGRVSLHPGDGLKLSPRNWGERGGAEQHYHP